MAPVVLTAQYLSLAAGDVSAYIRKATIELSGAKQETTTMITNGWETSTIGLRSGNLQIEVVDDFAAGLIDAILWGMFAGSTSTAFEMRPTQAVVGAGNPKLTGSVNVLEYKAGGSVGELAMKSITVPTTGVIARATS